VASAEKTDFRCNACGLLICKVSDITGIVVEAKCRKCGEITVARLEADDHTE